MKNMNYYKKFRLLASIIFIGLTMNSTGQSLLKDINPGDIPSAPESFFEYNEALYFFIYNQFWTSDGTGEGTVMIKEVDLVGDIPSALSICYDKIYFYGDDGIYAPFISDGTAEGTVMLKEIYPGSYSGSVHFREVNGLVVFRAQDGAADGSTNGNKELWVTDGTSDGTTLLKEICPGDTGSALNNFTVLDNSVVFAANNETNGKELWITDGTADGTVMLKDIYSGDESSYPNELKYWDNMILFHANNGTEGHELWKTDGTAAGTEMVKDIRPGVDGSSPMDFSIGLGGYVYFSASDGTTGYELWKTDGTEAGTTMVKDIYIGEGSSGPYDFIKLGGYLYFSATNETEGRELWRTNGTVDGTTMIKDIYTGIDHSYPEHIIKINNKLFFTAYDADHGQELWRSDGTSDGTIMLNEINPTGSIGMDKDGAVVDNIFYFQADDGVHGKEVWIAHILNFTSQLPASTVFYTNDTEFTLSIAVEGEGDITYQWQKDGVDLSGETTETLVVGDPTEADEGSYRCVVSDEFYGELSSASTELAMWFVSVEDLSKEGIKIYPNPSSGMFRIAVEDFVKEAKISIYDIKGRFIYEDVAKSGTFDVDISDNPKGVYILKTRTDDKLFYTRIILE